METDDRNITSEVEAVLEEHVRPYLAAHGGDLKVAGVEGGVVFFNLTGRCAGCQRRSDQQRTDRARAGHKESCSGKRHQSRTARADLGASEGSSQFLNAFCFHFFQKGFKFCPRYLIIKG